MQRKTINKNLFIEAALVALLAVPLWAGLSEGNGVQRITLEEAVHLALENNPTLKAARQAEKASQHAVDQSRFDLLPQADLQFSYARLDPGTVRRGNVFVDVGRTLVEQFNAGDPNDIRPQAYDNNFATTLQVVQPIYNGGANWASVGLAQARAFGAQHALEDTRQEVILQVKTRYLRTLQARELLALARKSLAASEDHLASARRMLEVGLRTRTDVLRWEVQKSADEGHLVEAENNLDIALAALKEVLGVPFETALALEPLDREPEPLPQDLQEQIAMAARRHPGLRSAEASLDAGRAGVRLAWAAFQPRVNFVYQLGWERNNTLALDSFTFWNATVAVQVPIFHSFSNVARLQQSKAEFKRLEERRTATERALTLQVVRARRRVESTLKRYSIAEKAVEQAEENLRVLENTYEVGLASNIDLLDGEVAYSRAQTERITAHYDYWIARAELARATGAPTERPSTR